METELCLRRCLLFKTHVRVTDVSLAPLDYIPDCIRDANPVEKSARIVPTSISTQPVR